MQIELRQIGKKFNKHWLFKQVACTLETNHTLAITGSNGSGKSTLLQIILGFQLPSTGTIHCTANGSVVTDEVLFNHIAFVAPYLELPEELTLLEVIHFHFSFKTIKPGAVIETMINQAGLSGSEQKQVKYFSSGMKQRLKLLLAFHTVSEVLLLDEPTSNLDATGISWYQQLLAAEYRKRTIIIASNQTYEYPSADRVLDITTQVR